MEILIVHADKPARPVVRLRYISHSKLRRKIIHLQNRTDIIVLTYFSILVQVKIDFPTHVTQQIRQAVTIHIHQHEVLPNRLVKTVEQFLCMHFKSRISGTVGRVAG